MEIRKPWVIIVNSASIEAVLALIVTASCLVLHIGRIFTWIICELKSRLFTAFVATGYFISSRKDTGRPGVQKGSICTFTSLIDFPRELQTWKWYVLIVNLENHLSSGSDNKCANHGAHGGQAVVADGDPDPLHSPCPTKRCQVRCFLWGFSLLNILARIKTICG